MKLAASDDIHQINSPSVAISAHEGPVNIESCSDKGGFSVLSSGPVQVKSGSSSLILNGNGDRGDIHIEPGQGGDLLAFTGNESKAALLGLRAGNFEVSTTDFSKDAFFSVEPGQVSFRIGLPGVGSSILMTGDSISLKVGNVQLKISNEGIEASTLGAKLALTQTDITEEVALSSRKLTKNGHVLSAAESRIQVDLQKVAVEGISVQSKGDLLVKNEGAMVEASGQATLSAKSAFTRIN